MVVIAGSVIAVPLRIPPTIVNLSKAYCVLPPKLLTGTDTPVSHILIGDVGFTFQTYVIYHFIKDVLIKEEAKKRRAGYVENALDILAQNGKYFLGL